MYVCYVSYSTLPHLLLCTITNIVITHVSLHCTAWQLVPDSFVLRLSPRCRMLAILKHRRNVPNIIRHSRKLHGTAGNVIIEESPYTSLFRETKGNELVHRNQFMDTATFSFLGSTQTVSLECDLISKGGVPTMRCLTVPVSRRPQLLFPDSWSVGCGPLHVRPCVQFLHWPLAGFEWAG